MALVDGDRSERAQVRERGTMKGDTKSACQATFSLIAIYIHIRRAECTLGGSICCFPFTAIPRRFSLFILAGGCRRAKVKSRNLALRKLKFPFFYSEKSEQKESRRHKRPSDLCRSPFFWLRSAPFSFSPLLRFLSLSASSSPARLRLLLPSPSVPFLS